MSDFKKLIKVKTVSAEKNVSLFNVRVLFQKGEGVRDTFQLKCPCIRKNNDKGYQCTSIKSHANRPTHATFRTDLQKAFDDDCIDGVKSLMKRNHFWRHEFTVNSKKAIYITFRVRESPTLPILATVTVTSVDPDFEFYYNGSVPHEVIEEMETSCSLLQSLTGEKAEDAYFCACVARNKLLHWCCGDGMSEATPQVTTTSNSTTSAGMTEATPQVTTTSNSTTSACMTEATPQVTTTSMRNAWQEEQEEEEPHHDEATSSTTSRSFYGNEKMKKAYLLKRREMAKIGIFIDPDLDDDGNKIVKEPQQIKQLKVEEDRARRKIRGEETVQITILNNRLEMKVASGEFKKALAKVEKEEVDDDDEEKKDEKEPHDVDEATSSTTQASIADGVKARSEIKQLQAEEEKVRRNIRVDEQNRLGEKLKKTLKQAEKIKSADLDRLLAEKRL